MAKQNYYANHLKFNPLVVESTAMSLIKNGRGPTGATLLGRVFTFLLVFLAGNSLVKPIPRFQSN
jgi:hypothetical protein